MRYSALCAAIGSLMVASSASAALTANWVQNAITAAAIAADPALANHQSWSLMATNTDGHWASAGVRLTLPSGAFFYQAETALGQNNFRPSAALIAMFPAVEFDTYVSSPRNQAGSNPPSLLGGFPETQPPMSFGGSGDPIPGTFAVSWGDPQATSGPGPGAYEILRVTFPNGVFPSIYCETPSPLDSSHTSQINPDATVFICIPEPSALGLLPAAGLLAIRRRSGSAFFLLGVTEGDREYLNRRRKRWKAER